MNRHPDCEDRCQILEHKGYHTCSQTGRCEQLEAMTDQPKIAPQEAMLPLPHPEIMSRALGRKG